MNTYRVKNAVFPLILLLLMACEKADYTEPVSVQFDVSIAQGSSSYLSFDEGTIVLDEIAFTGLRTQGGDVHFTSELDGAIIAFPYQKPANVQRFDIPQGIYTYMGWRLSLDELDDNELDDNDDDNNESDDESDDAGIKITGFYKRLDGTQLPLYILVDDEEQIVARTETQTGNEEIALLASETYAAQLIFDPYYATQTISIQSFEEAQVSHNEGVTYIEISDDENENLYESILFRLESSVKVVIQ